MALVLFLSIKLIMIEWKENEIAILIIPCLLKCLLVIRQFMRILYFVIFLVLLFACGDTKQNVNYSKTTSNQWTEEQKRNYFNDSIAIFIERQSGINHDFLYFFKQQYPDVKAKYIDPFIYAFEEPIVDTTKIDTAIKWFRLTVEPCFRLPYCLIVEKKKGKTFLTTKVTNGDGGYYSGTLALNMKFLLQDSICDNLINQLHMLNFWTLAADTTCHGGLDGETWIFESIDKGKYNVLSRWYPQECGNMRTKQLAQLGLRLREYSRLEKVLATLGEKGSI